MVGSVRLAARYQVSTTVWVSGVLPRNRLAG